MSNIHPIITAIEDASYETETQRRLIGDIVMILSDMPFIEVAIIHEIINAFQDTGTLLFQHTMTEMLNHIEKGDLTVKPDWKHTEPQNGGE